VYAEAGIFQTDGYAYVVDQVGRYQIIDKNGAVIYCEKDGLSPIKFDGIYLTFLENGLFGVANKDFQPLSTERFMFLHDWAVYGGILVYNPLDAAHRFYSLEKSAFVDGVYEEIIPIGSYFLTKTDQGRYILYDTDLREVVGESQYIVFDGEILLIGHGDEFRYYVTA